MKTCVLLTGANGFLGTQIARQLIYLPETEIIAMVRAKNNENALLRLKRAWYDWDELSESLNDGVKVIAGDVTRTDLNMENEEYQDLSSNLTHIIHTVADLRLHTPLEELGKTNVEGTRNLLKLAEQAHENSHTFQLPMWRVSVKGLSPKIPRTNPSPLVSGVIMKKVNTRQNKWYENQDYLTPSSDREWWLEIQKLVK